MSFVGGSLLDFEVEVDNESPISPSLVSPFLVPGYRESDQDEDHDPPSTLRSATNERKTLS